MGWVWVVLGWGVLSVIWAAIAALAYWLAYRAITQESEAQDGVVILVSLAAFALSLSAAVAVIICVREGLLDVDGRKVSPPAVGSRALWGSVADSLDAGAGFG